MTTGSGPELQQVLGALLFAAHKPMAIRELREVLQQAAQENREGAARFGQVREGEIEAALRALQTATAERPLGLALADVAGGFRFQTDPAAGPWVRHLLHLDKPARLSKPALETLAIIAYRQPITRTDIEALRGVNVDAVMRHLLEVQLVRIVGRSDLPGRPLLYGTTQLFLEHFGLNSVKNLPGIEQLSRRDAAQVRREQAARASAAGTAAGSDGQPAADPAADAAAEPPAKPAAAADGPPSPAAETPAGEDGMPDTIENEPGDDGKDEDEDKGEDEDGDGEEDEGEDANEDDDENEGEDGDGDEAKAEGRDAGAGR